MFKNMELSKLKLKKYGILASVSVFLITLFVVMCAAWASNSVNIYADDEVLNVKTKQSTVADVLKEASITLGSFDKVEPDLGSTVQNNMEITVSRAVILSVVEDGERIEYYSSAKTVEGVLNQTGYTLFENDRITPSLEESVTAGMTVEIRRAKQYIICEGEEETLVTSAAETVGEFVQEQSIALAENDRLNLDYEVALKEGMKIKIIRREVEYEDVTESIPYQQVTQNNPELSGGASRVLRQGKNGSKVVTYEIIKEKGEEIERRTVNTAVVSEPVNRIVEVGTGASSSTATASTVAYSEPATGKEFNYSKVLTCTATAYDLSYESCGKRPGDKNYGITASGMKAEYGVIAVDPRVIPLGTRLYVEAADGSWIYGYCVAGDTGGGISGNRIDLFYNSRAEALQFGRRQAKVYILS